MNTEKDKEMPKDNYSFGRCYICGKMEALKNGICGVCDKKMTNIMPSLIPDIFGGM